MRRPTSNWSMNSLMAAWSPVRYFGVVMLATEWLWIMGVAVAGRELAELSTLCVVVPGITDTS
jgi:hypothetical protein